MPRVNPFLDIEAEVDRGNEERDDNDDDDLSDFLDFDEVNENRDSITEPYYTWDKLHKASENDDNDEDDIESFLAHLRRHTTASTGAHDHPGTSSSTNESGAGIYPLYRVACREGMEEEALMFLLQKTRHERIRSAFLRESICGFIYLEAMVDANVTQLLMRTPGIRTNARGPKMEGIDQPDWPKLLTMKSTSRASGVESGKWVTVRAGKGYKGDIALVDRIEAWGVEVLLVPRIQPLAEYLRAGKDLSKKRKTKAATPDAQIFQEHELARSIGLPIIQEGPHHFRFAGYQIEYGLIRRKYSFSSIRPNAFSIPASVFHHFIHSHHPSVRQAQNQLPRPREWTIQEGDLVEDQVSNCQGTVLRLGATYLEVKLDNGAGAQLFPWYSVRKVVRIGDYVELASGARGWVVKSNGDVVNVIDRPSDAGDQSQVMELEAHINQVKHAVMPFMARAPVAPEVVASTKREYMPWVGTRVLITKTAWKGRYASIISVLARREHTQIVVRDENYDPNRAFRDITLDLYDVVEARSHLPLPEYSKNNPRHQETSTYESLSASPNPPDTESRYYHDQASAFSRPSGHRLTAAWDPNSRTPIPQDKSDLIPDFSAPPPWTSSYRHPLIDNRILNLKIKANVNGGGIPGTQLVVWLAQKEDGSFSFCCKRGHGIGWLEPHWIELRRPNPARETGLMVITNSESSHFGKLVRRASHRHSAERNCIVMRCVVVLVEDGKPNTLTSQELNLIASDVCLCSETKEEKDINKQLLKDLHRRY
ncbi:hypothetical protein CVT24_007926 [Panaeolus cyanescens]|uniref:NGN domain-containing protein n=1 Tax=Panaeolus cyanescens TaxID=181874 RepID=A0A409WCZ4_9AGAR|nr:hypothetical protein CVT24_007926 [Panaeolus cyanescens]